VLEISRLNPFKRTLPFDRRRLLEEAEKALMAGKPRRAVDLYRRVLAAEPRNPELNARIAPLLAGLGQEFDAWQAYRTAAQAETQARRVPEALALYREATTCLPRKYAAWQTVASLELRCGRPGAALAALREGRRHLKRRRQRPEAIALLRAARDIEPWNPDIVLDLAQLLARSGQKPEAQWLLGELIERTKGKSLRRMCRLQWNLEPSLWNTWRWLRAIPAR
jgi:tetratricopeptide (TPR) repeat protein